MHVLHMFAHRFVHVFLIAFCEWVRVKSVKNWWKFTNYNFSHCYANVMQTNLGNKRSAYINNGNILYILVPISFHRQNI